MDQDRTDWNFGPEASTPPSSEAIERAFKILESEKVCPSASEYDKEMLECAEIVFQATKQPSPFVDHLPQTVRHEFQRVTKIKYPSTPSSSHGAKPKYDEVEPIPDGMKVSTWLVREVYRKQVRLDLLKPPWISSRCTINLGRKKVQLKTIAPKLPNVIHKTTTPNLMDLEIGNVNIRVFNDGLINLNSASSFEELKNAVNVCMNNLKKAGYFDVLTTDSSLVELKKQCVKAMELNANVQMTADLPWNYDFDEMMKDASNDVELLKIFAYNPECSVNASFELKCGGRNVKGHLGPTGTFRIKSANSIEMAREAFVRISLIASDYRC